MTTVSPRDHPTVRSYVHELVMSAGNTDGLCKLNTVFGGGLGGRFGALDWRDWIHVLTKSDGDLALRLEDATQETYVYYTPGDGFHVHGESKPSGGGGGPCTGFDLRRWLYQHEFAKPVFRSEVPYIEAQATESDAEQQVKA